MQARLQQFSLTGSIEYQRQFELQRFKTTKGIRRLEEIDVFFRKIQRRLNQHAQVDQFVIEFANCP